MERRDGYLPPGAKFWDQPTLETILQEMYGLSLSLQGATPEDLVKLLIREAKGGDRFIALVKQLGAASDAGRIRGAIAVHFMNYPHLKEYLVDCAPTQYLDASGVRTYESYSAWRFRVPLDTRTGVPYYKSGSRDRHVL